MRERLGAYFETLIGVIRDVECTDSCGETLGLDVAFQRMRDLTHTTHDAGNKIMFIGNGGSAGIASHLATDYSKNGRLRSTAFNDGAALTCLGNDLGYENVFAKQVEWHGREGDLLIAISSSGKSANILNGVTAARAYRCGVVTCSGFGDDNPLRKAGDVNFYVRSPEYGFVEVAHLALLHAFLDLDMGWHPSAERW